MTEKYLVFMPGETGTVTEEWRQCLKDIIYNMETGFRLTKLNIFTNIHDDDTYIKANREIGKSVINAFGKQCPAYSITVQPPENPWKIAVEAAYSDSAVSEVTTKMWNSIPYVTSISDYGKELWVGGLGSVLFPSDTRSAAAKAYNQMREILNIESMSFDQLIRQWSYIGNIGEITDGFQNYRIFNEMRSEYYQKFRAIQHYPASTVVGMKLGGVIIDYCALETKSDVLVAPLGNPNHGDTFPNEEQINKDINNSGSSVYHLQQFENAVILKNKNKSILSISVKISDIDQNTLLFDDAEKQTRRILKELFYLVRHMKEARDLAESNVECGRLIKLRVHIKEKNDFPKVKNICGEHFPDVQALYLESYFSSNSILVEIDADFLTVN